MLIEPIPCLLALPLYPCPQTPTLPRPMRRERSPWMPMPVEGYPRGGRGDSHV